jgi:hypothetical protein
MDFGKITCPLVDTVVVGPLEAAIGQHLEVRPR